jgi:periplasmic protein TorT
MANSTSLVTLTATCAVMFGLAGGAARAADWFPYKVESWNPPFKMESPRTTVDYKPLDKAVKKWDICVSFPHMKDDYWMGVDYGVSEEAKRLGVKMQLVEAGGYTELNKQISQLEDCIERGAQALVIGSISLDGLNKVVEEARKKNLAVVDVINGISSPQLSAKSLVSFGEMGSKAGEYLVKLHPSGGAKVKVAWFPGPAGAGWVESGNNGFLSAVKVSDAIQVLEPKYGDTGKEVQSKLVEDALQANPDLNYIVGTAVTAEAAVPILKSKGLAGKVKVISYYYTPGVDQAIRRGEILAAPTDSTVIQGRIAIDQAVRVLEGKDYLKHVGPALFVVTQDNIKNFDTSSTLAPADFQPVFNVN